MQIIQPPSRGVEVIAEFAATGAEGSVTFDSIPATFRDLILRFDARSASASFTAEEYVRVNGLATAIYDTQRRYLQATSDVTEVFVSSAGVRPGFIPGASADANNAGSYEMLIRNYRSSWFKTVLFHGCCPQSLATNQLLDFTGFGRFRTTDPITEIFIYDSASTWVAGSVFTLLGVKGG